MIEPLIEELNRLCKSPPCLRGSWIYFCGTEVDLDKLEKSYDLGCGGNVSIFLGISHGYGSNMQKKTKKTLVRQQDRNVMTWNFLKKKAIPHHRLDKQKLNPTGLGTWVKEYWWFELNDKYSEKKKENNKNWDTRNPFLGTREEKDAPSIFCVLKEKVNR